ncbi:MAG: hypothetical protein RL328_2449 [Acidobacteriota bacterium]|jgi:AcrR family transcriptional regulator
MATKATASLREKQTAATREHILDAAYELLVHHPDLPFSHEAIAKRAGVGARTVYRYFPAQTDLYEELWVRVRKQAGTIFPQTEEQILPQVPVLFEGFDRNAPLIRAVLESPAGHQVRERGAPEGRASFSKSLERLTQGLTASEKRQIIGLFLGVYSAAFWQLLHERGGLSGPESIAAATWAMEAFLDRLKKPKKK